MVRWVRTPLWLRVPRFGANERPGRAVKPAAPTSSSTQEVGVPTTSPMKFAVPEFGFPDWVTTRQVEVSRCAAPTADMNMTTWSVASAAMPMITLQTHARPPAGTSARDLLPPPSHPSSSSAAIRASSSSVLHLRQRARRRPRWSCRRTNTRCKRRGRGCLQRRTVVISPGTCRVLSHALPVLILSCKS